MCRDVDQPSEIKTCILAGALIEKDGLFSKDKLAGLSMQSELTGNLDNKLKTRYSTLRKKMKKILKINLNDQKIAEDDYIQLLEDVYNKGEIAAYEHYFNKEKTNKENAVDR